jgi:hypothetical protein
VRRFIAAFVSCFRLHTERGAQQKNKSGDESPHSKAKTLNAIMRFTVIIIAVVAVASSAAEPKRAGPDWWALQPIKKIEPPSGVYAHPIDAFVRSRLATERLHATAPADKLTLIRRVTFDLTGLPPTPTEIDAFLADRTANAYENLVDRLLASPHYGERWARHWLDVVRYSESHGFEYDRLRDNAWRYRDYVIRSLNADKPFADFAREQIAGDVVPNATADSVVATGMLVCGPYDQAGLGAPSPIVRGKAREDELEDMLGTVSQTLLGVTLNCARCHDHKFDPYSARDYYRLKAIFEGVTPGDRPVASASSSTVRQQEAARLDELVSEHRGVLSRLDANARAKVLANRGPGGVKPKELPTPIARWAFDGDGKDSMGHLHAELKNGAKIVGGRLIVDGEKAFAATPPLNRDVTAKTLEAWVAMPTLKQAGGSPMSIQSLNGVTFDSIVFAEQSPLRWVAGSNNFQRTRDVKGTDETAKPGELIHLAITYDEAGRITIYRNGKPHGESYVAEGKATFAAKQSQILFGLRHSGGGKAYLNGEIEEARLYDRALSAKEVEASFRGGIESISREELRAAMSEADRAAYQSAESELIKLEARLTELRRPILTYAANPKQPGPTLFLKRGDFEKPGDPVTPGSPEVVKGLPAVNLPANATEAERRRAFADWVVHAENPLTWRVIVNRVWQHHFGEGLVRTPNDFGLNGEAPTHPELLDWLAVTLRQRGGSLKNLHRLIVTSATYRQASTFDAKAAETDAENRLLWRYAPQRLSAESIRDAMLSVSGKLNREAGGPSARPFRIETFNSAFYIPFDQDRPDFNRRSVYRMNVTSARDPVLDVLDCPDPSVKTPRRNTTTTPLQALTMMNNPFVDRLSKSFAERVKAEAGEEVAAQVTLAYRLSLQRPPSAAEAERAIKVAKETGLKAVCWALFNSSEFAYVK